jgi:putative serine protease PepD
MNIVATRVVTLLVCALAGIGLAACSDAANSPADSGASLQADAATSRTTITMAPGPLRALADIQQHFVDVVQVVRPSVVEIATSNALGSGIVYDAQGDIVTNSHVVGTARNFTVTWFDGSTATATLVGQDSSNDLAVIKVARTNANVSAATFADSGALQTGDIALAIGNPLGLQNTVTEGIVSATGRAVQEENNVVLSDTIQTSAAINPGNSGGALVDINGQVIGIPTLGAQDPQLGSGAAPGIGFAIPSNIVRKVADQLIAQPAKSP